MRQTQDTFQDVGIFVMDLLNSNYFTLKEIQDLRDILSNNNPNNLIDLEKKVELIGNEIKNQSDKLNILQIILENKIILLEKYFKPKIETDIILNNDYFNSVILTPSGLRVIQKIIINNKFNSEKIYLDVDVSKSQIGDMLQIIIENSIDVGPYSLFPYSSYQVYKETTDKEIADCIKIIVENLNKLKDYVDEISNNNNNENYDYEIQEISNYVYSSIFELTRKRNDYNININELNRYYKNIKTMLDSIKNRLDLSIPTDINILNIINNIENDNLLGNIEDNTNILKGILYNITDTNLIKINNAEHELNFNNNNDIQYLLNRLDDRLDRIDNEDNLQKEPMFGTRFNNIELIFGNGIVFSSTNNFYPTNSVDLTSSKLWVFTFTFTGTKYVASV